jgi:hypothetical protein
VLIAGSVELVDALMDIEHAKRDNKILDNRLHQIWAMETYAHILGRRPDPAGFQYEVATADAGGTREQMRARVARSAEAQGLISKVFQHHVGREPSADERRSWTETLSRPGNTIEDLELAIMASPEAAVRRGEVEP